MGENKRITRQRIKERDKKKHLDRRDKMQQSEVNITAVMRKAGKRNFNGDF